MCFVPYIYIYIYNDVYQFSSLKHVMMSSRAEGSIYNI